MNTLVNIILTLEILVAFLAILYYKKHKNITYTIFLVYVLLVVIVEIAASFLNELKIANTTLFNIYTFFEINTVALLYYYLVKGNTGRNIIKIGTTIFNAFYLLSFVYITLSSFSLTVGGIFVSFYMLIFLREFLNSDRIINFKKYLFFWVTASLLLYYMGSTPYQTILNTFGINNTGTSIIQIVITMLKNLFFIYGILWSNKKMI